MNKIKIAIADDHNMFIEGLLLLLGTESDLEISGIANTAHQLIELLKKDTYDIVILDINMPGMSGLAAIELIKHAHPAIRVIMLSTYKEKLLINKAIDNNADGYLIKNASKNELVAAIHQVYNGEKVFAGQAQDAKTQFDDQDSFLLQYNLTRKEKELIGLIKQGYTNPQMAEHLFLSIYTIKTHRKNIMRKLKLKTTVDLAKFIIANNL